MNKYSTLKTNLLELWLNRELKKLDIANDIQTERLPSNESIEFLKQFAAGYFPSESKNLEFECMLN